MQSGCGNAYQRQIVHQIEIQSMHSGMLYHDPRVLFKLTQISFNISWRKAGSSGGERKQSHPHRIKAERDRRVMNKVPNQVGQNASADGRRKTSQGQKETLLGTLLQMIFRPLWLQFSRCSPNTSSTSSPNASNTSDASESRISMVNVPRTSNTKSSRASDINTPSASNANSSRTSDANYPVNNTSQPQPLTINDVSTIVLSIIKALPSNNTHTAPAGDHERSSSGDFSKQFILIVYSTHAFN